MSASVLRDKSFKFAVRILKLHKHFVEVRKEYTLSKQLYRSGTSIGANVEEASQAESRADFIHKLSIAHKEAFETHYWIRLFKEGDVLTAVEATSLLTDCEELLKMLTASIKTAKAGPKDS
ncbi:MAG: four helix bundle protein [Bacteroidota bacterium]|nr:four helix bundle protein [Bacteroidota bacterium]MDP4233170.1 four helix bundle protein [Bacteroidota bacterium]MDP4241685.1 four helix bundle protein [Bacteroidota bacterium]MDP4287343.1 four helix bundle protein [Bacteroidota bacterium]